MKALTNVYGVTVAFVEEEQVGRATHLRVVEVIHSGPIGVGDVLVITPEPQPHPSLTAAVTKGETRDG